MLKLICFTLILTLSFKTLAQDPIQVDVSPENPVEGENFNLVFKIKAQDSSDPLISFNPGSIEVLGKENQGFSISTTLINGRFTTTKEIRVVYDLISNRSGAFVIKDIAVNVNGQKTNLKDLRINILSKKALKSSKEVFVMAEVSKKEVFVGEGINVDYYIYAKVPVIAHEIAEFPKLNKFLKRFQTTNEQIERVEYNGQVYSRVKKYSARIYPQKEGKAYIDPLKLKIQYSAQDDNSPFSGFGFSMRRYKNSVLSSPRIEINVKPLPSKDVPKDFTGLIGSHKFNLKMARNKFLINEAIEVQLEVSGVGALENFDAPTLYKDKNLETFDTKASFEENEKGSARKIFDYTYLGRGNINIPGKKITFSIFNPDNEQYESINLDLPELIVEGSSVANSNDQMMPSNVSKSDSSSLNIFEKPKREYSDFLAPIFSAYTFEGYSTNQINFLLLIILLCLILLVLKDTFIKKKSIGLTPEYLKLLKKGVRYNDFYMVLREGGVLNKNAGTLKEALSKLGLSSASLSYFKKLIDQLERQAYQGRDNKVVKLDKKHLKELVRQIEKKADHQVNNEDIQPPY